MNELMVFEHKKQAVVSSRVIAERFEKRHDNVLRDIQTLLKEAGEEFILLNFEESNYKDNRGKIQPEYILTKDGFTLLVMGYTGSKAMGFKIAYINRFNAMQNFIRERQTTEWLQTRQQGKLIRRDESDSIKDFILYAESQGSKNAMKYYTIFSKLVNKTVGVEAGKRDIATHKDLMLIALLEDMISNTVVEEMAKGVYYKEIYKRCQNKAEQLSRLAYLKVA
jgi:phage regulatory protein, rha family